MSRQSFDAYEQKPRFASEPAGRFFLRSRIRLNLKCTDDFSAPTERREDLYPIAAGLCAVAAALTDLDGMDAIRAT